VEESVGDVKGVVRCGKKGCETSRTEYDRSFREAEAE